MIEAAGFTVVEWNDPADAVNVLFVAKKTGQPNESIETDPAEVMQATALMARYQKTRARNLVALKDAARELTALQPRKIALWGAGRLFDLLVREGGFDPASLSLLIDTQLQKHMPSRHGMALSSADALTDASAEIVVVMSRMFADEIAADIQRRAPRAQIILYADLLGRARLGRAA
jgi:hypothetical protein